MELQLRLNNWIFISIKEDKYLGQVSSIAQKYVSISNGLKVESKNCQSIPLTEEWLTKAGFKIEKEETTGLKACIGKNPLTHTCMLILLNTGDGWFYSNRYFKIDSVHQLQNLYSTLTGEELIF